MNPSLDPVLIRCKQHGAALALIATAEGEVLAICPVCGSGSNSKNVTEQSAGLIGGLLSEEQPINLRKQIKVAQKGLA